MPPDIWAMVDRILGPNRRTDYDENRQQNRDDTPRPQREFDWHPNLLPPDEFAPLPAEPFDSEATVDYYPTDFFDRNGFVQLPENDYPAYGNPDHPYWQTAPQGDADLGFPRHEQPDGLALPGGRAPIPRANVASQQDLPEQGGWDDTLFMKRFLNQGLPQSGDFAQEAWNRLQAQTRPNYPTQARQPQTEAPAQQEQPSREQPGEWDWAKFWKKGGQYSNHGEPMNYDDEAGFRGALRKDPGELTARGAYSDWLEEQGRATDAGFQRALVDSFGRRFDTPAAQPGEGDWLDPTALFGDTWEDSPQLRAWRQVQTPTGTQSQGQVLLPRFGVGPPSPHGQSRWGWDVLGGEFPPYVEDEEGVQVPDPAWWDRFMGAAPNMWGDERDRDIALREANIGRGPTGWNLTRPQRAFTGVDQLTPELLRQLSQQGHWPALEQMFRNRFDRGMRFEDEGGPTAYGFDDDLAGMTRGVHQDPLDVTGHLALSDFLADNDRPADAKFRQDLGGLIQTRTSTPWKDKRNAVGSGGRPFDRTVRGFSDHHIPRRHVWNRDPGNQFWEPGFTISDLQPTWDTETMGGPLDPAWRWASVGSARHAGTEGDLDPASEWLPWLSGRAGREFSPENPPSWVERDQATELTPAELGAYDFTDLANMDPQMWPQVEALLRQNWDRFQQFADDDEPMQYAGESAPTPYFWGTVARAAVPVAKQVGKALAPSAISWGVGKGKDYLGSKFGDDSRTAQWGGQALDWGGNKAQQHVDSYDFDDEPLDYGLEEQERLAWEQRLLEQDPWDSAGHGEYADWLDEHGHAEEATFRRIYDEFLRTAPDENPNWVRQMRGVHANWGLMGSKDPSFHEHLFRSAVGPQSPRTDWNVRKEIPDDFSSYARTNYADFPVRMVQDEPITARPTTKRRKKSYFFADDEDPTAYEDFGEDFLRKNPFDTTGLAVSADWYDDQNNPEEAAFRRDADEYLRGRLSQGWNGPPEVTEGGLIADPDYPFTVPVQEFDGWIDFLRPRMASEQTRASMPNWWWGSDFGLDPSRQVGSEGFPGNIGFVGKSSDDAVSAAKRNRLRMGNSPDLTQVEQAFGGITDISKLTPDQYVELINLMRQRRQELGHFADDEEPMQYGDAEDEAAFVNEIHQNPLELTGHDALADWYADRGRTGDESFRRNLSQGIGRRLSKPWKAPQTDSAGWMLPDAPHGAAEKPWLATLVRNPTGDQEGFNEWAPARSNGDAWLDDYPEGTWHWGQVSQQGVPGGVRPEDLGLGEDENMIDWEHANWLRSRNPDYLQGAFPNPAYLLNPEERLWAGIDDWANLDPKIWPQLEALLRRQHGRGERLASDDAPTPYAGYYEPGNGGDYIDEMIAIQDALDAAAASAWHQGAPDDDYLPGGELPVQFGRTNYAEHTQEDFLRRIMENPEEASTALAYVDWLYEQGRDAEASIIHRAVQQSGRGSDRVSTAPAAWGPRRFTGFPQASGGVTPRLTIEHLLPDTQHWPAEEEGEEDQTTDFNHMLSWTAQDADSDVVNGWGHSLLREGLEPAYNSPWQPGFMHWRGQGAMPDERIFDQAPPDPERLSRYASVPRDQHGRVQGIMQGMSESGFRNGQWGPKLAPSPMNYDDREALEAQIAQEPRNVDPHLMLADWHREQRNEAEGDFREGVGRSVQRRLANPWKEPEFVDTDYLSFGPHGPVDPYLIEQASNHGKLWTQQPSRHTGEWWWSLGGPFDDDRLPAGSDVPHWRELLDSRMAGKFPGVPQRTHTERTASMLFPAERAYAGIDDLTTIDPELWPLVEQIMRQQHGRGMRFEGDEAPTEYNGPGCGFILDDEPVMYPPNARTERPTKYLTGSFR